MKARRQRFLSLALIAMVAVGAFGADAGTSPLIFPQLDLTDGRKLKNVVVRTFDRTAGKLLVVADGKAMLIPLNVIPTALHPQLAAYVPPSGETVSVIATPRPIASAADQYQTSNSGREPIVRPSTPPQIYVQPNSPAPPRQPTTNQLLAAQSGTDVAAHKAAASKRAEAYYRFEYRVGSDAATVTGMDLDLLTPKPVAGWEGRYRTEGKAMLEFYDSRGRSFQRRSSSFEVTTEKKVGSDDLVVIDFTAKN